MAAALLLAFIALLTSVVFVVWNLFVTSRDAKTPPSPPAIPIIGHLHLLQTSPHLSLLKIARKYGPLVQLRLGSLPVLFASSPAMSREILRSQDHVFASRPRTMTAELLCYDSKDLILAPYGEYWRTLKALLVQELLSEKMVACFQDARKKEVKAMISQLIAKPQQLRELLDNYAYNTLTQMLIGKTYYGPQRTVTDDEEIVRQFEVYKGLNHEMVYLAALFPYGEYVPFLKRFDKNGDRMSVIHGTLDKLYDRILLEQRQTPTKCFLSTLLSLPSESREEQDEAIKAFVMGLMAAGTDAVAVHPEWAMLELLHNPLCMKKAQEEMDDVIGRDRLVLESDIPKLPYLQAIVKETFRMHPPVPFSIAHFSMEDAKLGPYNIPKGSRVFVNIYAVNHDPSVWELPDVFSPERFLNREFNIVGQGQNFELTPFGSGRRGCPGSVLGLTSVHLVLANLLHAFTWELPNGKHPTEEHFATVLSLEVPLKPIPTPRLAPSVYKEIL